MSKQKHVKLDEKIASIQHEKLPERELWKGIEFEIAKSQQRLVSEQNVGQTNTSKALSKPSLAIAASLLIVTLVGYFSFQTGFDSSNQDLVNSLSTQHRSQVQTMLTSFEGQQSATQNWREQLLELDNAAAAIKKALEEEPNNLALLNMLKKVHEQQISLIERVHQPSWQKI